MQARVPTVLVDPSPLFREGLERILASSHYRLLLKKGAATIAELAALPSLPEAAVVLFLVGSGSPATVDIITWVKDHHPNARVVVLADVHNLDLLTPALRAGAHSFLLKTMTTQELLKSLELIMHGESVIASVALPLIYNTAPQTTGPPPAVIHAPGAYPQLSDRERQILSCLARGDPNKVIARDLQITESTVKIHVKAVLRKIKVRNRTQAAIWALSNLAQTVMIAPWVVRLLRGLFYGLLVSMSIQDPVWAAWIDHHLV
jgi:two-component system nitrate/nitrite response regulator NarL